MNDNFENKYFGQCRNNKTCLSLDKNYNALKKFNKEIWSELLDFDKIYQKKIQILIHRKNLDNYEGFIIFRLKKDKLS